MYYAFKKEYIKDVPLYANPSSPSSKFYNESFISSIMDENTVEQLILVRSERPHKYVQQRERAGDELE